MSDVKKYIENTCKGPHRYCNWVTYPDIIPAGRIMMSAYPLRIKGTGPCEPEFIQQLQEFPKGVHFVCLQENTELQRLSNELYPYYTASNLSKYAHKSGLPFIKCLQLEIPDVCVTSDGAAIAFAYQLYQLYEAGESLIIHCLGGHGRTGTIVGILYGMILMTHNITPKASILLDWLQHCHTQRVTKNGWFECPQTNAQCQQVQRLYYKSLSFFNKTTEKESPFVLSPKTSMSKYVAPVNRPLPSQAYTNLSDLFSPNNTYKTAHEKYGRLSDIKKENKVDIEKEKQVISNKETHVAKKSIFSRIMACCTNVPPSPKDETPSTTSSNGPRPIITDEWDDSVPIKQEVKTVMIAPEELVAASLDDDDDISFMESFWGITPTNKQTATTSTPTATVKKPPILRLAPKPKVNYPSVMSYGLKPKMDNKIPFEMSDLM